VLFEQYNSHVSVASSLMALFVTWVVLIAISLVGGGSLARRRRKTRQDATAALGN